MEADKKEKPSNDVKSETDVILDRYLNALYDRELRFNGFSKKKAEFIQNGIEYIVGSLVDVICSGYKERFYKLVANIRDKIDEDIYTTASERFLKVGSFYEGTKNYFPNEFDFIVIFFTTRHPGISQFFNLSNLNFFFDGLEKISKTLAYTDIERQWEVRFNSFVEYRGPAAKLQFAFGYLSDKNSFRDIHVDLTSAIKIIDCDENVIKNYLYFGINAFRNKVLETGSYLLLSTGKISFTETEVKFLKQNLSEKHRKVYRILKYLINGHGQDEILLHQVMKTDANLRCSISSYALKNVMIYHHYSCTRHNSELAQCTLEALKAISKLFDIELAARIPDHAPSTVSFITVAYYDHLLVHYTASFVRDIAEILNCLIDYLETIHLICEKDVEPWAKTVIRYLEIIRKERRRKNYPHLYTYIHYSDGSDIFWESIRRSKRFIDSPN